MKNSQRFVFTAILASIALDIGSFTKLKNIWAMAFTGNTPSNTANDPWAGGYEVVQGGVTPKTGPCAGLRGEALHICLQQHGQSGQGPLTPFS